MFGPETGSNLRAMSLKSNRLRLESRLVVSDGHFEIMEASRSKDCNSYLKRQCIGTIRQMCAYNRLPTCY